MQTIYTYPLEVLVVESEPEQALLMTQALDDAKMNLKLRVMHNGPDALAFLRREGSHAGVPRPHLVLLDLNLQGMCGNDVLAQIKGDEELKSIPVVVFGDSDDSAEVARAYQLHANCYVTKPRGVPQFLNTIKMIQSFWLCSVKFPISDKIFR